MHTAITSAAVLIVAFCLTISPLAGATNGNGNAYGHDKKAQDHQSTTKGEANGKNKSGNSQHHEHKDSGKEHEKPAKVTETQQPARPHHEDAKPVRPVEKTSTHKEDKKSNHVPVTICHKTGSAKNPYVKITVDDDSITKQGHDQHHDEGDIIPPFTDDNGKQYAGLNWTTEGQAIWKNSCKKAAKTPVVVSPVEKPSTPVKPVEKDKKPAVTAPVTPLEETEKKAQPEVTGLLPQTGPMRALVSAIAALVLFAATAGSTYLVRSRFAKQ